MPRLSDTVELTASREEIRLALESYFEPLRGNAGAARVRLRVPVNGALPADEFHVRREVSVEVRRSAGDSNFEHAIAWTPEGRFVFPSFEGTLAIRAGQCHRFIELNGWYTQPVGPAGQLFDAETGGVIAAAIARTFLAELRRVVEIRDGSETPRLLHTE